MSRSLLLIDGDQYAYKACAAVERDVRWDEDNHVLVSNAEEAWDVCIGGLEKVFEHFGHHDCILAMGDAPYFRHALDANYKGGRTRKPLALPDVRDRLRQEFKVVSMPGLEADDVMGILSTKPGRDEKIIVARDKDMKTVPGKLWDGKDFSVISEQTADYWHMYQTLVGDTADGYKGCPGIGPKKAEAILAAAWSDQLEQKRWQWVVKTFVAAGLTEADALKQARLARILRWEDWDSEKKEPRLWTPT